jgi:putative transposase
MPGPTPLPLRLSLRQRQLFDLLARRQHSSQQLLRRLEIVRLAADGANNDQIARQLPCHRETAGTWRARWHAGAACLEAAEAEGASQTQLLRLIEAILADDPRSGAPATFSPESLVQIMALACEDPTAAGRPVSHWTPRELADEAVRRGIVARISPRSVGRFLKGGRPQAPSEPLLAQRQAPGARGLSPAGGADL